LRSLLADLIVVSLNDRCQHFRVTKQSLAVFSTAVLKGVFMKLNPVLAAALIAVASLTAMTSVTVAAEKSVEVGGAPMFPSKDIIDNAVNSKDHTTLVTAVKAAGLVDTLKGKGPFTVFAPTNTAFEKLPAGTVDTLLKPENKTMLSGVLTYHVVAGKMDSKAIAAAIKKGKGKAELKTVAGGVLTASMDGKDLVLTDEKGGTSKVTVANVYQKNGVIHVVDTVLMPK
jgi:uncharacterized surface protein with fasciclin (FAS1) repeats